MKVFLLNCNKICYTCVCFQGVGATFFDGKGMIRDRVRMIKVAGLFGLLVLSVVLFCAYEAMAQGRRPGGSGGIKVGQEAPDFDLPKLIITRNKEGKPIGKISEEKIKLSSFRGKKPVCMIMSSYT